jgi:hypothetical protein
LAWSRRNGIGEEIGIPIPFHEEADYEQSLDGTRVALGNAAFDQAWRDGRAVEPEDAARYAANGGRTGST